MRRLLVGLVIASALLTSTVSAQTDNERLVLHFMNVKRAEAGVPALAWNDQLFMAAKEKADEQALYRGICPGGHSPAHDSCDGTPWFTRVGRHYPGWVWLGENAGAFGSDPEEAVEIWSNSTGHYRNIVDRRFTEAGAAMSPGDTGFGTWWWSIVDFGSRGSPPPTPRPTKTPVPFDAIEALRINHTRAKTIVSGFVTADMGADLRSPAELTLRYPGDATLTWSIQTEKLQLVGKGVQTRGGLPTLRMTPARLPRYRFRFELQGPTWAEGATGATLSAGGQSWSAP